MLMLIQTENPEDQNPADLYASRWQNINGLLAHFTNHDVCTSDSEALVCISEALEEHRREEPVTPINHRVPAAAVWFALCPSVIYEACQQQECADCEVSGALWKGDPQLGYSIARWEFWKKRFGELADHSDATQETKDACMMAIKAMEATDGCALP